MMSPLRSCERGRIAWRTGDGNVLRSLHLISSCNERVSNRPGPICRNRMDPEPHHVEGDRWVVDGPADRAEVFFQQPRDQRWRDGEARVDAGQAVLLYQRDQL